MKTKRIAPKRTFVQALLTLLFLLFPLLTFNTNPLFRIDIIERTLFMAGMAIRIDQFYLVLIATLWFVILFLLLTVVVGRVWCGWMCPQTLVNEIGEVLAKKIRIFLPKAIKGFALYLVALPVSLLFSVATLLWFMSPQEAFSRLSAFADYPVSTFSFLTIALILYLDICFVKRSFCKFYCPYGRFQVALQDTGTLNLTFAEETRAACICCNSCVRVCPMGIDIREGFQVECISCGRCIDACRSVMCSRSYPDGLISYVYGGENGGQFRLGGKTVFLLFLTFILTIGFLWGLGGKSENAFAVQRNPMVEVRSLPDGTQVQGWKAIIGNRGQKPALFTMETTASAGNRIRLAGAVKDLHIAPNENRTVTFFIQFDTVKGAGKAFEIVLLRDRQPVAKTEVNN